MYRIIFELILFVLAVSSTYLRKERTMTVQDDNFILDDDIANCSNSCLSSRDGVCDDPRGRSAAPPCKLGTDCKDCGPVTTDYGDDYYWQADDYNSQEFVVDDYYYDENYYENYDDHDYYPF